MFQVILCQWCDYQFIGIHLGGLSFDVFKQLVQSTFRFDGNTFAFIQLVDTGFKLLAKVR